MPGASCMSFCRRYWPLAARNTIRGVLRKCIQCNRAKFRDTNYLMDQLPVARVQALFYSTSVDFVSRQEAGAK